MIMSTSPWKTSQPDEVADKILKRAEVGKIGRKLKARLALAQFKAVRGWEDLTLDKIEPKVEEELRRRRPTSSGAALSDCSSSTTPSEQHNGQSRRLMSSPLKGGPIIFSDQIHSRSGSRGSTGHRKRTYHNSFEFPTSSAGSRKRFRSSPIVGQPPSQMSWKVNHQLPQSSPIKARKHAHFTTSSGPNISFYNRITEGSMDFGTSTTDDEDDNLNLPVHSFNIRSSPPRTPPPIRHRNSSGRRNNDTHGKSIGEEGADLLLYLATSPSPAQSRSRMLPPSTPPPKNLALPSSMMTTPGGGSGMLPFGNPSTPSQAFEFSDFVNITPSPAQTAFKRSVKTPSSITNRHLNFDNLMPTNSSPNLRLMGRDPGSEIARQQGTGLGMQLGGDLRPRA